jgi:DNA-binding transcriptional LysR family regulator
MDRFRAIRASTMVAEEQSFARAARRLGMSPPAVTRAVSALEERLGARLFKRTTRIVRLTEAGERYFADCKRILAELEQAEAAASGSYSEPRGEISVTAPSTFGRMFVAPIVLDFLACYPKISARTFFVDRVTDLLEEGMDVAVRIARLADSSLSAIRVGSVRRVVCASPGFLAEHGVPQTPADLMRLEAIGFANAPPEQPWVFRSKGRAEAIRPQARLFTDKVEVAISAAVAGRGVTRLLSYQVAEEVRLGHLRILLAEFEPPPVPVQVVHVEGRRASARLRSFVDFAVERLRREPSIRGADEAESRDHADDDGRQ